MVWSVSSLEGRIRKAFMAMRTAFVKAQNQENIKSGQGLEGSWCGWSKENQ